MGKKEKEEADNKVIRKSQAIRGDPNGQFWHDRASNM